MPAPLSRQRWARSIHLVLIAAERVGDRVSSSEGDDETFLDMGVLRLVPMVRSFVLCTSAAADSSTGLIIGVRGAELLIGVAAAGAIAYEF